VIISRMLAVSTFKTRTSQRVWARPGRAHFACDAGQSQTMGSCPNLLYFPARRSERSIYGASHTGVSWTSDPGVGQTTGRSALKLQ
jgi:hypothetical protein